MKYLFVAVFFVFASCEEKKPEVTWDEELTIDILSDLRIIDSQVKKHHITDRDSISKAYKNELLTIYNMEEEELINNLKIIQADPALAKKMEILVMDNLDTLRTQINEDEIK